MFISPSATASLAGLKEVPARLVVAKWGTNESANGNFVVNHTTAKILPALQKLLGFEEVVIDFEHNTVPGTEAYKAEKEPRNIAAQRAKVSVIENEGIVFEGMRWTPEGDKSLKGGLHSDLSPTLKTNDRGEVVFIHSAALCRNGAVTNLHVHSAADLLGADKLALFSATLGQLSTPSTDSTMDYKKLLTILLGLAPNASDADIETACKTYSESVAAVRAHSASLGLVNTALAGMKGSLETMAKRLDTREREELLATAIKAGKVVPHGAAIDALGNDAFKALLDTLPAGIVPMDQRTPEGLKTHAATLSNIAGAASAETASDIARQFGNDPDKIKKYGDKTTA